MRISDWSSDVCSSDLDPRPFWIGRGDPRRHRRRRWFRQGSYPFAWVRMEGRSEERRVGKECVIRVDLGGRRIIKKKTKLMTDNTLVSHITHTQQNSNLTTCNILDKT